MTIRFVIILSRVIIIMLSSRQLNSVSIHVASHQLELALHVELYRLKMAVLGIYCMHYVRTVKHLSGDHSTLAKESMLQLLCVLVVWFVAF